MNRLTGSSLYQLTRARVAEFLREPEAVFWVFLFPVVLAVALGIAFRNKPPEPVMVGVEAGAWAEARQAALAVDPLLRPEVLAHDEARPRLEDLERAEDVVALVGLLVRVPAESPVAADPAADDGPVGEPGEELPDLGEGGEDARSLGPHEDVAADGRLHGAILAAGGAVRK